MPCERSEPALKSCRQTGFESFWKDSSFFVSTLCDEGSVVAGGAHHLRAEEEWRRLVGGCHGRDNRPLPWQLRRTDRLNPFQILRTVLCVEDWRKTKFMATLSHWLQLPPPPLLVLPSHTHYLTYFCDRSSSSQLTYYFFAVVFSKFCGSRSGIIFWCGSGMEKIRIRDPGWEKCADPG